MEVRVRFTACVVLPNCLLCLLYKIYTSEEMWVISCRCTLPSYSYFNQLSCKIAGLFYTLLSISQVLLGRTIRWSEQSGLPVVLFCRTFVSYVCSERFILVRKCGFSLTAARNNFKVTSKTVLYTSFCARWFQVLLSASQVLLGRTIRDVVKISVYSLCCVAELLSPVFAL